MWKLRVRTLEGNAAPAPPPPQTPGQALVAAVKEVSKDAAKEVAAETNTTQPK